MYMTKKHQNWTMGEKDALLPYLDGEDDEILEYAIINKDFAIILKNDMTYDIKNTRQEAIDFISYIYRNYSIFPEFRRQMLYLTRGYDAQIHDLRRGSGKRRLRLRSRAARTILHSQVRENLRYRRLGTGNATKNVRALPLKIYVCILTNQIIVRH